MTTSDAASVVSAADLVSYNPSYPWYAIRVRSRSENFVYTALQAKDLSGFLPTYTVRNRWSDRMKRVELPLFPGYVFCRIDISRRLPVLITPGVVEIVGVGKTPEAIPESQIEAIQIVARAGAPAMPWPYLREGQKVRITHGSLRGLEGILLAAKKDFKIVISIEMLQRSVAVEIDRDSIEPKDFYGNFKAAV
ncbi:MAG: UpxY family transcription antiterminator [Acidobacteriia bacterium]|nr:UpxY family transcription antiterminator [Terriglobia bacterium]